MSQSSPAKGGRKRRAGAERRHQLPLRIPESQHSVYVALAKAKGYRYVADYLVATLAEAHSAHGIRVPDYIEEARVLPEPVPSLFDDAEGSGAMSRAS